MKLFTFKWMKCDKDTISITVLDETGKAQILKKVYKDWIGIATNDINSVVKHIRKNLCKCRVSYQKLDDRAYKEILPLFYDRIKKKDFEHSDKSFYKVYVDACTYDVGDFLNSIHVSYYLKEDWLTRIYIDLRTKLGSENFYYSWYDIDIECNDLMDSFLNVFDGGPPPMMIGSFDFETVPWEVGSIRFPTGHDENDIIVMISLVLGTLIEDKITDMKTFLFYLNPIDIDLHFDEYKQYSSESQMIKDFLQVLNDPRILFLTGYNINNYDFPCLFARLVHLNCEKEISLFTSKVLGKHVVTTFRKKNVIDLYNYIVSFSPNGLPSFKLDDVAKVRLGESKVPIRATSIHKWYQARDRLNIDIIKSNDLEKCYNFLKPGFAMSNFGTFTTCLEYSLQDSILCLKLLVSENVVSFLMARSNMSTMNIEEVLYIGNSKYIQNSFETYGTLLGYFINLHKMRDVTSDVVEFDQYSKVKKSNKRYQGALNYCKQGFYSNVEVYDFESLYPSSIVCCNISYESFAVVHVDTYQGNRFKCIPFRLHDESNLLAVEENEKFMFPTLDCNDKLVMVFEEGKGFLPTIIEHLMSKRRQEKILMTTAKNKTYHKNRQLSYKIIMNSIYGCLGSDNGLLSNFGMGMSVCCIARNILIGANRYAISHGFQVPYCDTDSLFVVGSSSLNKEINKFFGKKCINLQFEKFYPTMLCIKRKKYCLENVDGKIQTKGFEVKSNSKFILATVLDQCYKALKEPANHSKGWILLIDLLIQAYLAKPVCLTRKVRALNEYSDKCKAPHVRLMKRSDRKIDDHINFTYIYTDISKVENDKLNPVFVEDVDEQYHYINFEKIFLSQKMEILTLYNLAFFKYPNVSILQKEYDKTIQLIRWKQKVNASILCYKKFNESPLILTRKSLAYSFKIVA